LGKIILGLLIKVSYIKEYKVIGEKDAKE